MLAYYSKVDRLGARYKSGNFGEGRHVLGFEGGKLIEGGGEGVKSRVERRHLDATRGSAHYHWS